MRLIVVLFVALLTSSECIQAQADSLENERLAKEIALSEVVVRSNMNVPAFLKMVKEDTSFYKAFKNLRILGYTSINDIRMLDKKGNAVASLYSKTTQIRKNGCRTMQVSEEKITGNLRNSDGEFNYYTPELYASLFFTKGEICGENNIVGNKGFNPQSKGGMEKRKEQLKMLFFDPGKRIVGIPFMGGKSNIFSAKVSDLYAMDIDLQDYEGKSCYVFSMHPKTGLTKAEKSEIVYNNMVTWFDKKTMEIVRRTYDLSYRAGLYDFDVNIEVLLTHHNQMLVPQTLRYRGNWDVAFKKRERGLFTATLYNFK